MTVGSKWCPAKRPAGCGKRICVLFIENIRTKKILQLISVALEIKSNVEPCYGAQ
jgi:hypothetical protein